MNWNEAVAACEKMGDDWSLPTNEQLELMYVNLHKAGLGGFINDYYWSATAWRSKEKVNNKAWFENFANGDRNPATKDRTMYVRAVRIF